MNIIATELLDAYIIEPQFHEDSRGWFMETFNARALRDAGINTSEFIQDNHSYSAKKGIVRALHCQIVPYCQTKLFRCTSGEIFDVIVDVREGSPTYRKWIKVLLTAENRRQIFIPKGFLHGFVTLTDRVEVQYKVDCYYNRAADRSIRFDDPVFGIDWGIKTPILSDKDREAPFLCNSDVHFTYGKLS